MDFLKNIKYTKKYVSFINDSKYIQSSNSIVNKIHDITNSYKTLEELIVYTYNHDSILNDNTQLYIDGYKLKLATDIDENTSEKYDNYKYSNKMKKKLIQNGLQKKDTISTILYLGDIFSIDIIIKINNKYHKLINKNRSVFYVEYKDKLWRSIDKCENTLNDSINELQSILDFNIKISDVYTKFLKSIHNYKLQELIDISEKYNIDTHKNGKKKTKLELYNEINIIDII
jgi:hypothetical protein